MFWDKLFKKKIIQPTTLIGGVISNLENLDNYRYKDVYSSDYSNISFMSLEKTIGEYTNMIRLLNSYLTSDRLIYNNNSLNTLQNVYISDFFTEEGCYIDTKLYIERFKNEAIKLLKTYEDIEKSPNISEIQKKKILGISQVINNIIQITEVLNYG